MGQVLGVLIAVLVVLVSVPTAYGAIAVEDTSSTTYGAVPSVNLTHNVTTGGISSLLLVGISFNNAQYETVSSVVWKAGEADEQSLQLAGTPIANSDDARVEIWYLKNPNIGDGESYDVKVIFSTTLQFGGVVGAMTFTGVYPSSTFGTYVSAEADGLTASVTASSATNEWVFDTVACETCTSLTANGDNAGNERWNENNANRDFGAGSTAAGAASVNMSWAMGSSDHWAIAAIPIKPDTGGNYEPYTPNIDNYNDGSCTTDTTPTLQFDLSDPNSGDIVKYQIQIDNNSDFGSPEVDYTEPTGTAEPRSNVQYTPSALSQDEYYWRVKAIDDEAAESDWATANGGSVAFIVDTADPTTPGNLTENSKTASSITLNFGSQTTEANFDSYKIFYKQGSSGVTTSDTEHLDSDLGYIDYNGTSTTTISGLSGGTQYVINIWAYDKCGNNTSATEITVTTELALYLANNASGQVQDKFIMSTPVTDVLYQFELTRGGTVTVDEIRVNFTTTDGVANNDVTDGELWRDDGDGVYEGAGQDTQLKDGITPVSGVITFSSLNESPGTAGTIYFVRGTVSNLVTNDTTTFSCGTADIDVVESNVTESGTITDATHAMDSVGTDLCAFNFLTNHADVTPSGTGWQDVDVSTWVPSGATGVLLQATNTSGSVRDFLVRKKVASSPDAYANEDLEVTAHCWPMVGLDSNRTFQVYTQDSTSIKLYLIGYTGDGVTFFDNRVDKTPGTPSTWMDVDISSDTGGDTAIAAIVGAFGFSSSNFGMRKKTASPDDRTADIDSDHQTWGLVGVDGSEIYQVNHESLTGVKSYLYGYVTSGVVMFDNGVDHSTGTTGSYVDVDITNDLQGSDDATGAIVHLFRDGSATAAIRKNAVSYDRHREIENHQYGIVQIDDQDIFEQKISTTNIDLFVLGYTLQCAGATTTTLGDGTDPSNSTVAPGSTNQIVDRFTFVASSGSDSVTALTVTTANTDAIASVEIWNNAETTQYFTTDSTPNGNLWEFSGGTAIPVSDTAATFVVRFTAKGHATLPSPIEYAVTGTVTDYTCTNSKTGTDTDSATITVDNDPPDDATWGTITPGNQQVELNWTNPVADFNKVLILRKADSAVGDTPDEGTEYSVPGTIGSSTIVYVGSGVTFTDTGLTNGTDYYYKIFAYDDYINYASGAATGPHTPTEATEPTVNYRSIGTSTDDLKTGTPNITIISGTATLTEDQTGNIGVGDKITYDTSSVAYITAKQSNKVFTVQTEAGGTPADVSDKTVDSIKRAYNTLQAWEDPVASNGRGGDLQNDDRVEVGVCYKDGAFTSTGLAVLRITGNTTDSTHYFELTVAEGNRHDGTAGATGTSNAMIDGGNGGRKGIWITDGQDVHIEWLELKNFSGANYANAIHIDGSPGNSVQLEYLLIHDFENGTLADDKSYGVKLSGSGGNTVTVRNSIVYNGDYAGITGDEASDTVTIENCTIYGILGHGINAESSNVNIKNTICVNNGKNEANYHDFTNSPTLDYCISEDDTASCGTCMDTRTPTSNGNPGAGAWVIFNNLTAGSEDFHLQYHATENDALDKAPPLSFTDDIDGETRPTSALSWDIGADEYIGAPVTINYRSIGTNAGTLYSTGTASICSGDTTVNFSSGASLPEPTAVGAVGLGDKLTIGSETFYILSRDSATQVTVQSAATADHETESYTIERAYTTIQAWEDPLDPDLGRGGDLVSENRREIGVCYKDGAFSLTTGVTFDGSTSDSDHYMHLTVAEGQRHNGRAGTGVVVDSVGITSASTEKNAFLVRDPYVRIEWLEIKNLDGTANLAGQPINLGEGNAGNNLLSHLMIHDYTSTGRGAINVYENATVRNCIIYNGDKGIRSYSNANLTLTLENVTIYNMSGTGVHHDKGKLIVKNTISVGTARDFDLDNDDPVDGSSGYNMYSTVHNDVHPGASSGAVSTTFAATGKTITRATGSFLTDGFVVGNTIKTDASLNPGPFTISNVTDLVITVNEAVVDEGPVTITVFLDEISVNKRSPPADLDDLFYSITAGSEDLHIHSSGHLALNEGQDLSGSFTDDIDGDTRPQGASWDIGADEHSTPGPGIYVDGNLGSDTTGDGSWDNPYQTVQHAEDDPGLGPGDTIYIRGGITYDESELYVNVDGTSGNPITFTKWPGPESNPVISEPRTELEGGDDAVAIRGDYIIFDSIDATTNGDDGYDIMANNVTIQNCSVYSCYELGFSIKQPSSGTTIDNCKIYNNGYRGIMHEPDAGAITIKNCEIYGSVNAAGIYVWTTTAEAILIEYNIIRDNTDGGLGYGIRLSCNGATVRYNKIYGNNLPNIYTDGDNNVIHHNLLYNSTNVDGLQIDGGSSNIVYNNTIDGNNRDGIRLLGAGSGNIITNNIISNNVGYGINDVGDANEPVNSYNCLYGNSASSNNITEGTGTITSDPLYVDRNGADNTLGTADDDFHLQSTWGYFPFGSGCVESASDSPCIDAGAPSGDYSAYSNEPEGNGGQVNMGVYGNTTDASKSGAATAISLLSFTATGDGPSVLVAWETAQEINNMGFYLYRSTSRGGPYTRLTVKLIPGLFSSVLGKEYTYEDTDVIRGKLYYYKLEDLDAYGTSTFHGPICVDWDADGLPDDWEIAHGLNPAVNDAYLDSDFDGLTNLEEYEWGTDPLNPDTDGDGILDGDEAWRRDRNPITRSLGKGVEILAADDTGMTLELVTDAFDMEIVEREGEAYERLRILDYIHGYIHDVGKPEVPLKGILLDLPAGRSATVSIEETESETYSGYWIYPVPENVAYDDGAMAHVEEVFAIDEACYSNDALYPDVVTAMGNTYTFRDQQKLQILFYPIAFNPVTRELKHYTRIRVRVTFEDTSETAGAGNFLMGGAVEAPEVSGAAWTPPSEDPVYKVLVSEEGIYRLTKTFFTDNDIDVDGMDLSQVRLYTWVEEVQQVEQVAIHVNDQVPLDQFDDGDYIEFYGRPLAAAYAKYAKHNIYWLTTSGGMGAPKRMTTIDGAPGAGEMTTSHTDTVTYELDQRYWIGAPGDDSLDRWFFNGMLLGDEVEWGGDPVNFTFSVPGAIDTGDLTISLSGYYDTDHEVTVWLNGDPTPIATLTWSGITAYEGTISPLTFDDGDNTVTLRCESGLDIIYVDKFVVTYPRSLAASNNELIFTHDEGYRYQITGFTTTDLMAFDITAAGDVARVIDFETIDMGGSYTLDCEPQTGAGVHTYYALATDRAKTPVGISEDEASSLSATANSADYILITHRDLGWDVNGDPYSWLSDLVAFRQAQDLRVTVVDVEDIYDEFTYGIVTPQAIKDFLSYAYANWTAPAPQYVLLVGDSNFDCKDNLGQGNINFVPAYLTFTEYMGEAPTDEWFVRVSGTDSIPDLYIGRLPAASAGEAAIMVNKIIAYEGTANTKTWEKNVLLVADNETQGNDYEADFEIMSEEVAALIPAGMSEPFKGYLGDYVATGPLTADIKEEINQGTLIVNYSGHGSTQIWAGEVLFDTDDVPDLTNDDELVFVINMTCMTGYFAYPELGFLHKPSLMEGLLRPEGKGAVAALMPTGMTTTTGQRILDTALFEAIFTDDIRTLGPAISQAKQTLLANGAQYEEMSETFLLFGDPAMKLKIPVPRRPTGVSLESTLGGIIVSWNAATDCNGDPVAGYNVYRSTTSGENYTKINTALITGTEYTDTSAEAGTTYYYVVRAVDYDGDESVQTLQLSALAGIGTGSGPAGSSGPCFISTAAGEIW